MMLKSPLGLMYQHANILQEVTTLFHVICFVFITYIGRSRIIKKQGAGAATSIAGVAAPPPPPWDDPSLRQTDHAVGTFLFKSLY